VDYGNSLQPRDDRRGLGKTLEERIGIELDKIRSIPGVRVEGRTVFVPFHHSGLNPVQFLARNGFVVRYI
jgi:hypothetical protein